jgi:hypothetical protein
VKWQKQLDEEWKKCQLILETQSGCSLEVVKTAKKLEMKAWIAIVGIRLE